MKIDPQLLQIQHSCYFTRSRGGEQFIPEHAIGYVVSGSITMTTVKGTLTVNQGGIYFCRRNQLTKYTKEPPEGGEFRSVAVFFDQEMLRNFSMEYGYTAATGNHSPAIIPLSTGGVMANYMESLRAYETVFKQEGSQELLKVKQKEAILILLQFHPEFKDILFDFSEPGKIDLEAFMNRNYHFNVGLQRFAFLTGRSLSTFKRDFEKIFNLTPSRWLLQRRLQEAYYMIKEKSKVSSDIYLELGFEDLSHFSFAFKKQYGIAPSLL